MNDEKDKWTREFAAGGVVYKKHEGQTFVLLVQPKGPNFGPPAGYWTFPKGLLDKEGESKEQVAVREVREEGGVNASIIAPLGTIKFFKNSLKVIKFVDFYLMEYVSGDIKDHDFEIAETAWVPLEKVLSTLKYSQDKEVFSRALKFLNKQS